MYHEKTLCLIVMEDEEQLRQMYTRFFGESFAELRVVSTCEELIDAYVEKRLSTGLTYDVVVLDMEIYGEFFCGLRALRELEKIDSNVRAILCSSSDHDAMLHPRLHGFKTALFKPFNSIDFLRAVKVALD
jgi:DNA-binding response OmpR family regulator